MTLEERLARLEHDRAIRDLKMRYLRAADAKDPAAMRACFLPDARIRFEGFPDFDGRDSFIAVYEQLGCAPGVFDIHQGGPGIIEFTGADEATGWWPLLFHSINLAQRRVTQLGVEYEDRYRYRNGRWWIAETRSVRKSCLIEEVDSHGRSLATALGEAPAAFG